MSETVRSMTGFGSATFDVEGAHYRIELRSVNHRNLNIRFHMSSEFSAAEASAKRVLRAEVIRGSVDVTVALEDRAARPVEVVIDHAGAQAMKDALSALAEDLGCPAPSLQLILRQGDFVNLQSVQTQTETLVEAFTAGLTRATADLNTSRATEGAALADDLDARLAKLDGLLSQIETASPAIYQAFEARLRQRLEEAVTAVGKTLDEGRVASELILFSDRCDVTEETVRARAHIRAFRVLLQGEVPDGETLMGKRCEFLTQELGREFNTIGSKCRDSDMSANVVTAKVELERIREQVHNIA
ncbi:MAG: YicC/YloC family endoribonuclease [Myxococcota bacterium]